MLPAAVMKGDVRSVKRILDGGDEENKQLHGTCICLAARKGHGNIVRLLIEHGFDVNQEDAQGHTAVYYSVVQNDFGTTELLLQNGAKTSTSALDTLANTDDKYDLIFLAARKGIGSIVKVLVDFGADVNTKDEYGQTPLHHAILQESAVFTFLKETAKINICAMETVVHLLLTSGTDVNAKTVDGFSPLHFAIKLKYATIVSALLEHGADFHSLVHFDIISPKLSEFRRKSNQSVTLGRRTIIKPRLTTVLHIAADSNDVASVNLLLRAGAPVDSVQHDGTTPLIVAIKREHGTVVKVLLESGADVEQKNKYGLTPLHVSCRKSSVKVLNSVLEAGANVNAVCDKGKVAYQYVLQLEAEMKDEYSVQGFYYTTHQYFRQRYSNSLEMKTILQNHCFLMYINGYYLHDYNKEIAMKTPNIYRRVTKNEIEEFSKNVIICNNVTLCRVFNEIRYPVYLRNPSVLKGLDQAVVIADTTYPGLGSVVMFLMRSARCRVCLIDTGIKCFINLNRESNHLPTLPFDVLEIVFSLLLNEEIQNFINCGEEALSSMQTPKQ